MYAYITEFFYFRKNIEESYFLPLYLEIEISIIYIFPYK